MSKTLMKKQKISRFCFCKDCKLWQTARCWAHQQGERDPGPKDWRAGIKVKKGKEMNENPKDEQPHERVAEPLRIIINGFMWINGMPPYDRKEGKKE